MGMKMFSTLAVAALSAGLFFTSAAAPKMEGPMPGDAAPAFSLPDQDGKTVNLSDYAGKVVVLEWFNNDCPFVQKHYKTGSMNALATKYEGDGVVWLAVNSTSTKTMSDDKSISQSWKIERPILLDARGDVGKTYGSKNTPTMYVIGKDGKVDYRGAIDNKADPDPDSLQGAKNYVAQALDEVLAGKSVSEPMTKAYGCSVKYAN